ncbi:hypothetical protein [Algoriphagus terrigena]|uniref:hypothetical protein n=1 Tax=Algoriphagus terrigena TaxID=344884 RepID=UPI00041D9F11|nr:hypothetical protein [Algoriphagus terrigena]
MGNGKMPQGNPPIYTAELEKNKDIEDEKARDEHQSSSQKVWEFSYWLDIRKSTD